MSDHSAPHTKARHSRYNYCVPHNLVSRLLQLAKVWSNAEFAAGTTISSALPSGTETSATSIPVNASDPTVRFLWPKAYDDTMEGSETTGQLMYSCKVPLQSVKVDLLE